MPMRALRALVNPRHIACGAIAVAALCSADDASARGFRIAKADMEPLRFSALDGWNDDDHSAAFSAFSKSCTAILQTGKIQRKLNAMLGGLFHACSRASALKNPDRAQARQFFEENFRPVHIVRTGEALGFLTGYYETEYEGSRKHSDTYNTPVYAPPPGVLKTADKINFKAAAAYNRTAIEEGLLAGKGLEICWLKSPIDAFFAQIQGSTRVRLADGKLIRLNYAAHNGLPYYPVGRDLIDRGIVAKEEMTMDKIRDFMEAHPEEGKVLRRKNQSFVFFREVKLADHEEPVGAQGIPLTAGRSIAVDKNLHTYGTPFWLEAELPIDSEKPETRFRRLMVAQDTGSAIRGPARADIYFGAGEEIGHVAGRIKQFGRFVMLVPRGLPVGEPKITPLPRPKPDVMAGADSEKKMNGNAAGKPQTKPRPKT